MNDVDSGLEKDEGIHRFQMDAGGGEGGFKRSEDGQMGEFAS